jgi:hypothetical protein
MTRYEVAVAVHRPVYLSYQGRPAEGAPPRVFAHLPGIGSPIRDVPKEHWAEIAVFELQASWGILGGYPNGTYVGDRTMTRYECAATLRRLLEWCIQSIDLQRRLRAKEGESAGPPNTPAPHAGQPPEVPPQPLPRGDSSLPTWLPKPVPGAAFRDVPDGHWAMQAVVDLHSDWGIGKGILTGYADGTFAGDRALTRYEFAIALQRLFEAVQVIGDQSGLREPRR